MKTASAFAPAAITNFFRVSRPSGGGPPNGATGGGYVLSKGALSRVSATLDHGQALATKVNGDAAYDARTTRRAVSLLAKASGARYSELAVDQVVDVPIGCGFGASAASAISVVFAAGRALGTSLGAEALARFAHDAEIAEGTGVGTVSVTYKAVGAGAITKAGAPGVARFLNVAVPRGTRIVTASIAPYDKRDALASRAVSARIDILGKEAQASFMADPTFESLASAGEWFSKRLGLETPEVKKLIVLAKDAGATHASQNMMGYAVHSIVNKDESDKVAGALRAYGRGVRVDVFEVGRRRAGQTPSRK